MEPLNKSLKNITQFILRIQDSCDKHRTLMEKLWLQEYTSYVSEWNKSVAELQMQREKNIEDNLLKASKCTSMKTDEDLDVEELALVDSLLQKARNIRIKSQTKRVNGLIDNKHISSSDSGVLLNVSNSSRATEEKISKKKSNKESASSQVSEKNKVTKKLSHSKSDFIINTYKRGIVLQSKSATLPIVPKDKLKLYNNRKNFDSLSPKCGSTKYKTLDKESDGLAIISRKDLEMLTKIPMNLPSSRETVGKSLTPSSDASGSSNLDEISPYPSNKEFINIMKGRLSMLPPLKKLKIWYPYLSSESETFLTAVNCDTFCSLKKVYSILCCIQETMIWIDLLFLIESEICPTLIVNPKDMDMLRICSYLRSIFHPNSQRIPILNPNR